MLFNSIEFAIFILVVFVLYWFFTYNKTKFQNTLLLIASYFFYAYWDWRFLFLLVYISFQNYLIGLIIQKSESSRIRKSLLFVGIIANIGPLAFFKYFDFLFNRVREILLLFGFTIDKPIQNVLLPLGISFYVFLSLSYIIDIYQNKLEASNSFIDVFLTFSFFPIILAGPIQRPISLLPQIQNKRVFNYSFAADGMKQILWGLFMKTVIADKCAVHVNGIFQNYISLKGSTLFLGGIFYSIQIYSDFAGYSLIAIGVSKLFGFKLNKNFSYPYFSRDMSEFWKRWHISLTNWFRDYIFLPISYKLSRKIPSDNMGFIKTDLFIYIIGIIITWLLTGFWHGGNYTFVIWGFLNGLILIIYHILKKPRKRFLKKLKMNNDNIFVIALERVFTLFLIVILWIIFRATDINHAWAYISKMFSKTLFTIPDEKSLVTVMLILLFILVELLGRKNDCAIEYFCVRLHKPFRWAMYYAIILSIFWFNGRGQGFIYSQF